MFRKRIKIGISIKNMAVFCVLLMIFLITACGRNSGSNKLLVGRWASEYRDIVVFNKDGSCRTPFTYNSSWGETATQYALENDDTLTLSSETGHADRHYDKADSKEEALEDSGLYFVSKDILVIKGEEYTRSKNNETSKMLAGNWVSDSGDVVSFEKDGSCSAPFTYNPSWWESADQYAVREDKRLVLGSEAGQAGGHYDIADSEEEALEDSDLYFVSKDTFVIERTKYTRSK